MAIEKHTLEVHGVEIPVIYEQSRQLPLFYVQFIFKGAGGISDAKLGISELTSALLNEGTKTLGAIKFAQKLEEKALSLSVDTGVETLSFTLSGMQSVQKDGIRFLGDLLNEPNFTKDVFQKVFQNTMIALLEKETDYDYQANHLLKSMLFKGSRLEFPLIGTQESLKQITLNDIKTFYKKHINLESLHIVIGGDIVFKEIVEDFKQILNHLPKGKRKEIPPFLAQDSKEYKRILKDTQQAYVYFGAPLNVQDLQKELAFIKVASFVLGGSGFGSRMLEEVRVKRGLAYSAVMYLTATKTQSYALGYLQTSLKNEKEAQNLVKEVVQNFVENGITQEELEEAKHYLLGSEPLRNETLEQRLSTVYFNHYNGLSLDFNQKVLQEIQNLKLDAVNAYVKAHKEIANLSFAVVSADTKDKD